MEIEKLSLFKELTQEEIDRSLVCSKSSVKTYKKEEYIFRQGDTPKYLYFILSGEVELGQVNPCYLMEQSGGREEVRLPMNRENLAAYLNTARPSLSRELSLMQEKGIISIAGRNCIRILDFELLSGEMEGM